MQSKLVARKMAMMSCSVIWEIIHRQNYYNNGRFHNQNDRNGKIVVPVEN